MTKGEKIQNSSFMNGNDGIDFLEFHQIQNVPDKMSRLKNA